MTKYQKGPKGNVSSCLAFIVCMYYVVMFVLPNSMKWQKMRFLYAWNQRRQIFSRLKHIKKNTFFLIPNFWKENKTLKFSNSYAFYKSKSKRPEKCFGNVWITYAIRFTLEYGCACKSKPIFQIISECTTMFGFSFRIGFMNVWIQNFHNQNINIAKRDKIWRALTGFHHTKYLKKKKPFLRRPSPSHTTHKSVGIVSGRPSISQ